MTSTHGEVAKAPADYIDSDHQAVKAAAGNLIGKGLSQKQAAVEIYAYVRDRIRYDPYVDYLDQETYRASSVLAAGRGYCVGKAALMAALCRAAGIPARLGLADVRNHLSTPRLLEVTGTDLFSYHGFTELNLGGTWIKASPTFNAALCEKLSVAPLPFDGAHDALLQAHDRAGRSFMDYVADHGRYYDVPTKFLMQQMRRLYPRLCVSGGFRGNMEAEVSPQL